MSASSPKPRRLERDEAPAETDGAQRVRLRFLPDGDEVRVPSGTPIFDAASWNGIAIDSTCGGHGTCKKCKVRIVSGDVPVGTIDPRAFTTDELRDGWRLACRATRAQRSRRRSAAAADAAQGGARRCRAPRDSPARGAEASSGAGGGDARGPALRSAASTRRDRRPRAPRVDRAAAHARRRIASVAFRRHGGRPRRRADRRRARRHHRVDGSRSRSTSAPRRSSRRCSISTTASPPRSARCSTASSPTAPM